jgi:hypothetical protein
LPAELAEAFKLFVKRKSVITLFYCCNLTPMTQLFNIFPLTKEDVKNIASSPNQPHNHDYEELIVAVEGMLEHFIDFKSGVFDAPFVSFVTNGKTTFFWTDHTEDIVVHWPDGHVTTGIEKHIDDLKAMFVYAPNTQIKQHLFRFGSANYTAVTGIMTGTFSKPMPIGNGKFIQPTGKSFSLPMCTIGIWKDGTMSEEYLYWDNQT